ncbi:MAG: hypothetical protein J6L73_03330 [Muribaculaceae bacterium]|nr:hypothetical protein [Muribaculaceae bacterium]
MRRPDTGQNIALSVTVIVALLLLILLTGTRLSLPERKASPAKELTMADIKAEDPEDKFIEPILQDAGEPSEATDESSAPLPQGEPKQAPVENDRLVVNGDNPEKNPSTEKLTSVTRPNPAKTTTPSKKDEPDQAITSAMKGQFSSTNGRRDGRGTTAVSGAGGAGTGVSGTMGNGRKLESWTLPSVSLTQRTVIRITVMVRADGTVESATAQPGSAPPDLKEKCRRASLNTRWTPKTGAPLAKGTITWTLVPKV